MDAFPKWLIPALAALAGLVLGAMVCGWQTRRAARAHKRIPARWPLHARLLANTEERAVWHWLCRTFPDHCIMIKIPVTRFTLPREKNRSRHWYEMLTGVYCTLTICAPDGRVVGCLDVPGGNRLSRSNRHLKQTLLAQCGIGYWVVESRDLPDEEDIRAEFLGESESFCSHTDPGQDRAAIAAARSNLRAAVERQRQSRPVLVTPLSKTGAQIWATPESQDHVDEDFEISGGASWQQPNSFVAPLDSRRGGLR